MTQFCCLSNRDVELHSLHNHLELFQWSDRSVRGLLRTESTGTNIVMSVWAWQKVDRCVIVVRGEETVLPFWGEKSLCGGAFLERALHPDQVGLDGLSVFIGRHIGWARTFRGKCARSKRAA